jgi:hypothetical protein
MLWCVLLGLTLACGLGRNGEPAPSPEGQPAEATEESPTPEAVTEEPVDFPALNLGRETLESYVSHFEMTVEDPEQAGGTPMVYELDMQVVSDPFAQHIVIQGGGLGQSMEIVQIEGRQYLLVGAEQCIVSEADIEDAAMEIFKPDDVIAGLEGARRVGSVEEVNGIPAHHYVFDEQDIVWGGLTEVEGELWVAAEGDYVVKFTLQAQGEDPFTGRQGSLAWLYELMDVNVPLDIVPPAACQTAEEEFPLMPDAADVTRVGGMISYTSASSFEDVLAFYQEAMLAEGWTYNADAFVGSDEAVLSYTREGETASITLSAEESGVSVVIVQQ